MPVFNGTNADDSLTGGAGDDTLYGEDGNDTLDGVEGFGRTLTAGAMAKILVKLREATF